jgi:hypothetical protein
MIPETCLLCGSTRAETVLAFDRPDQYELAVGVGEKGYGRRWERCRDCGLHYSRYSRDPGVIDRLYKEAYRDQRSAWRQESSHETFKKVIALPAGQSETRHRVAWVKEKVTAARAAGLVTSASPPWRLLDVGGASGVFAYEFVDDQWRAEVMDPSSAGQFLSEEFNIPYHRRPFARGALAPTYDLISLVYTLEHLADPLETLRSAQDGLRRGGFLFVEVPDAIAFRLKPGDDDIFNSCHLWMFDPATLTTLFTVCGFELFSMERVRTVRGHCGLMALAGVAGAA